MSASGLLAVRLSTSIACPPESGIIASVPLSWGLAAMPAVPPAGCWQATDRTAVPGRPAMHDATAGATLYLALWPAGSDPRPAGAIQIVPGEGWPRPSGTGVPCPAEQGGAAVL
jgi:hypothetical protein